MKKIISAALAAFMAVTALSASAFAEISKADSSIALKATTVIPTLKVTLPKTLAFVVNPYKMEIDKSTGKAADSKTAEGNKVSTFVVPVYGTTTNADKTVTVNTAWQVANSSGLAISAKVYATAVNADTTGKLQILDGSGSTAVDITDGEATADAAKKQLTLKFQGKSSKSGAPNVPIAIRKDAPADWTAETVANFANIPNAGTLDLTLDTESSICAKGADCADAWTAKDTATLNVFFKFDFVVE